MLTPTLKEYKSIVLFVDGLEPIPVKLAHISESQPTDPAHGRHATEPPETEILDDLLQDVELIDTSTGA